MARGRGGHYDSDVVVVKTARRSHLPDENFDLDFDTATRKAQRVSNYAFTDADALKTASRRHDQALLDDITSKLIQYETPQPVTVTRSRQRVKVIPQTVVRGVPIVVPTTPPRSRRAASIGPAASFISTPPPSPRISIKNKFRAGSEPPLNPTADLAVRQARRSLNRLEHELGNPYRGGYDQYYDEPLVNEVIIAPRTSSRVGVTRGAIPRRSHSLPRQSRQTLAEIEADVEAQMVRDLHPPAPLSTLRSKAVEARSKLDRHRTLLDRYLPLNLGPENDVSYEVENKYGELVQRMPSLDPYRPNRYAYSSSALSSSGASKPPPAPKLNLYNSYGSRPPPPRPKVSEARRHAREVLCRTKGDPHYFG